MPYFHFDHIHIDIVAPLPPSQGCTHLLTILDSFTRWPEEIPLKETDNETMYHRTSFPLDCLFWHAIGLLTEVPISHQSYGPP